jgi:hypothetical protein
LTGSNYELLVVAELLLVDVEIKIERCFGPDHFTVASSMQAHGVVEVETDAFIFLGLEGGVVDVEPVQVIERFPVSEESAQIGDFFFEFIDKKRLLFYGFLEHGLFSQGLTVGFLFEFIQSLLMLVLLLHDFGLKGFEFGC